MARQYRAGKTLREVGEQYGISRERVRQIISKLGVKASEGGEALQAIRRRAERAVAKDRRAFEKYGCSYRQYQSLIKIGKDIMARGLSRYTTPTGAFIAQRNSAKNRGIEWEIKLWDWWRVWQESGKWDDRGRGQGYVMCRRGDTGPYSVENVFIAPARQNTSDNKSSDLPIGVTQNSSGNYQSSRVIDGKRQWLGVYRTPEEAKRAYDSNQKLSSRLTKQKKIKLCPHCGGALN